MDMEANQKRTLICNISAFNVFREILSKAPMAALLKLLKCDDDISEKFNLYGEFVASLAEYNKRCKELGLPNRPEIVYKDKGWIDSYAFFGKEKKEYPSYEKALEIVQKEGIKNVADYFKSCKRLFFI